MPDVACDLTLNLCGPQFHMWKNKRISLGISAQIFYDSPLWREEEEVELNPGEGGRWTLGHTPSEIQSHNSVVPGPKGVRPAQPQLLLLLPI